MHLLSYGHASRKQVWHSTSFSSTSCCAPCGHHIPGNSRRVKSETHGVPTAAARCCTPESLQTSITQRPSTSHESRTVVLPARLLALPPIDFAVPSHIVPSAPPPGPTVHKPRITNP